MSKSTTVYAVGTPQGAKVNSYEAMTNSLKEAEKIAQGLPDGVIKHIKVQERKR